MHPARQAGCGRRGAPHAWSTTARASCGRSRAKRSVTQPLPEIVGCWAKNQANWRACVENRSATHVEAEDRHPQGAQVPGGASTVPSPRADGEIWQARFCGQQPGNGLAPDTGAVP